MFTNTQFNYIILNMSAKQTFITDVLDVLCRHTKTLICRETKRATADLNILIHKKWMKNDLKFLTTHSWMRLKCLSLAANYFLGSQAAVFLLKNRSRSSKFVSIEIDRNTKVHG